MLCGSGVYILLATLMAVGEKPNAGEEKEGEESTSSNEAGSALLHAKKLR